MTCFRKVLWLVLLCALYPAAPVLPQVFGESARTEFMNGIGLRLFYGRVEKGTLISNGEKISSAGAPEVKVNMLPAALVYGVHPRFSLIGVVPLVQRTVNRGVDDQRISESDGGIGDITVLGKFRLYRQTGRLSRRQLSVQAGVKLPSGSHQRRDSRGERFPQPLQLGSGSFDLLSALTLTEARNRWVFSGDVGYNVKTEADDFRFGNVLSYDAAAKFRIFPASFAGRSNGRLLYFFLELNGTNEEKSVFQDRKVNDSGGWQLFLSPGFQWLARENLVLEAGVQIPVRQELNGTQLGTDFNFRSGLRWLLTLR